MINSVTANWNAELQVLREKKQQQKSRSASSNEFELDARSIPKALHALAFSYLWEQIGDSVNVLFMKKKTKKKSRFALKLCENN